MKLLQRYFDENFFLIPIRKQDKRPLYKKWTDNPLSYWEAYAKIKEGYNLAVVSGKQSIKEGYELVILDIDKRPETKRRGSTHQPDYWLEHFRQYNTWISLTPNKGYHIYLRVKPFEMQSKIKVFMEKHHLAPHRTTLDPDHDSNTFPYPSLEDSRYFADTIRWTSMYALLKPSTLPNDHGNGRPRAYWWLDDCKGDILKL